ncbi:MAG: hypothetical protein ACRCTD_09320 [Beijerinckiaceae bacterium]
MTQAISLHRETPKNRLRAIALAACAAASVLASPALADMTFRAVTLTEGRLCKGGQCPTAIMAEGEITRASADQYLEFLKRQIPARNGKIANVVFVHSPGGSVIGSIQLGLVWRKLNTMVMVARPDAPQAGWFSSENTQALHVRPAGCFSACVYALMGGTKRVVPDESKLGVHQTHRIEYERDIANNSALQKRLAGSERGTPLLKAYAKAMGINGGLIDLAQSTTPDSIRTLTPQEIRRFKLSNGK